MTQPTLTHDALADAQARDPLGHDVHTALAMAYLFLLPLTTAGKDICFALLLVYALLRLPKTLPCYGTFRRDRFTLAFGAWAVVHGLSILWSADVMEGLTELKAFRVILIPLLLWPVLDRVVWLIGAMLAGVFVMNLLQIAQVLGVFGLSLEGDGRARAGLQPIQTGAFNLAALTWYVSLFFRAHWRDMSRRRIVLPASLLGAAAAAFGVLACGSRGVWIAAVLTLPIMVAWLGWRSRHSCRVALAIIVATAIGGTGLWMVEGDYVRDRIDSAREEYKRAGEGDYTTSVGLRVLLWKWGWRFFEESPVYGIGAGSFRERAKASPEHAELAERWPGRVKHNRFARAHPHSTYLHVLSATGVLGAVPFLLTIGVLLLRTIRERRDHVFASASFFLLLGWLAGANADCYNLNGHLFGLFAFIAALAMPGRAAPRGDWVRQKPIQKEGGSLEGSDADHGSGG